MQLIKRCLCSIKMHCGSRQCTQIDCCFKKGGDAIEQFIKDELSFLSVFVAYFLSVGQFY